MRDFENHKCNHRGDRTRHQGICAVQGTYLFLWGGAVSIFFGNNFHDCLHDGLFWPAGGDDQGIFFNFSPSALHSSSDGGKAGMDPSRMPMSFKTSYSLRHQWVDGRLRMTRDMRVTSIDIKQSH